MLGSYAGTSTQLSVTELRRKKCFNGITWFIHSYLLSLKAERKHYSELLSAYLQSDSIQICTHIAFLHSQLSPLRVSAIPFCNEGKMESKEKKKNSASDFKATRLQGRS